MSYDKAIKFGKSHRKPYRGAKAIDPMCRNNKGCTWCAGNRTYQRKKEELKAISKIKEELNNE